MADSEAPAEISVADAERLARMYREWTAFKRSTGGDTQGGNAGVGVNLNAPVAWVRLTAKTAISGGRYRYTVEVLANPFGPKLPSPLAALASSQSGYAANEWGTGTPSGDAIATLNGSPVLAQLFWTWVESNNPASGYWAWWFNVGGGGGARRFQMASGSTATPYPEGGTSVIVQTFGGHGIGDLIWAVPTTTSGVWIEVANVAMNASIGNVLQIMDSEGRLGFGPVRAF